MTQVSLGSSGSARVKCQCAPADIRTVFVVERHRILWDSASVSRSAIDFQLTVPLDGEVSADWQAYLNGTAEQDGLRIRDAAWRSIRVSDRTIVMDGLEPATREQARAYLDELVQKTNDAVSAKLEQQERERLEAELQEKELERTAEELAEWFRTAEPSAPALATSSPKPQTETNEDPERGRPLELPDLRRRFVKSSEARLDRAEPTG